MRLSPESTRKAVQLLADAYGEEARIWLFGSRVDDTQRGGDVDIFVEAQASDALQRIRCKSALTALFDLKVDLIVGMGDQPIHRIAKTTGLRLK